MIRGKSSGQFRFLQFHFIQAGFNADQTVKGILGFKAEIYAVVGQAEFIEQVFRFGQLLADSRCLLLQKCQAFFGFGRLPGDLNFRIFGREFNLPFTTTIILSLVAAGIARFI